MKWLILIVLLTIISLAVIGLCCYYLVSCYKKDPFQYSKIEDPYTKPYIIKDLITKEQCDEIIKNSKEKLFDSEVLGGRHENIRNSKQTWIPKNDPSVKDIILKICHLVGLPFDNAEDLQVVRYHPGQYYNEHHDSCCDKNESCQNFIKRGGQRKLTVLIYLNNDFTEGETFFKNLNQKFKASIGSAIVFHPLAKNSYKCHPLALHAGLPVKSGEKWIANLWFRENKFI